MCGTIFSSGNSIPLVVASSKSEGQPFLSASHHPTVPSNRTPCPPSPPQGTTMTQIDLWSCLVLAVSRQHRVSASTDTRDRHHRSVVGPCLMKSGTSEREAHFPVAHPATAPYHVTLFAVELVQFVGLIRANQSLASLRRKNSATMAGGAPDHHRRNDLWQYGAARIPIRTRITCKRHEKKGRKGNQLQWIILNRIDLIYCDIVELCRVI